MSYILICRFCLTIIENSEYTNLSTEACKHPSSRNFSLKEKIAMYITELDVNIQLNNPVVMCKNCVKSIEDFHKFKWKCKETEKLIYKYMHSFSNKYTREHELVDLVKVAQSVENFTLHESSEFFDDNTHPQDIKPTIIISSYSNGEEITADKGLQNNSDDSLNVTGDGGRSEASNGNVPLNNLYDTSHHLEMEDNENIKPNKMAIDRLLDQNGDTAKNCKIFDTSFNSQAHKCKINYSDTIQENSSSPLFCLLCNKTIGSKYQLKRHFYRIHMKKPQHRCKFCLKLFRDRCGVLIHMRVHTGERPYECDVCHKGFTTRNSYKNHKALHENKRPYPCNDCDKSFINVYELSRHTKSTHLIKNEIYECNICSQKLCSNANLRQHKLRHADNRPLECDICFRRFLRRSSLNTHRINKHSEHQDIILRERVGTRKIKYPDREFLDVSIYNCNSCSRTFTQKQNLEKHVTVCHVGCKEFSCGICQKRFATRKYLSKHNAIHIGERFECDICTKRFSTRAYLKVHMRIHSDEQPFQCDICGKTFSDKGTLERHISTHSEEKPYTCDLCPKRYTSKLSLNSHKLSHTAGYTVKCFVCSKQINKAHVKIHMRIHTGEKPFACQICCKKFITARRLRRHMVVHTKEKLFKCDICYKLYTTLDILKVHQRIHTGEKPFQCDICGSVFSEKNSVKRHRERMHNNERFHCETCLQKFPTKREWKTHKLTHSPYECDVCKKQFSSIGRLNAHKRTHIIEKTHKCNICQKQFRDVRQLYKHERIIPEEKCKDCKLCNVKFKYSCEGNIHRNCRKES